MKILLVRLSSMGDLIHTLPAIEDLSQHQPELELHWLAEAGFADIARLHPFVHTVLPMQWRRWRKTLYARDTRAQIRALYRRLRSERYDAVIDSQGLLKSAVFARFAGAPVKGLDKASAREPLAACFYRQSFQVAKGRDAIWRNRSLLAQIFAYAVPDTLRFGVRLPAGVSVEGLPPRFRVALHATSRDSKLWPEAHWVALLNRLHEQDGAAVWLPWGNEAERQRSLRLAGQVPAAWVGERLDLLHTAWVMQQAAGIIGVDTGLLHLANALDQALVGM